jgi:hypothetical protein
MPGRRAATMAGNADRFGSWRIHLASPGIHTTSRHGLGCWAGAHLFRPLRRLGVPTAWRPRFTRRCPCFASARTSVNSGREDVRFRMRCGHCRRVVGPGRNGGRDGSSHDAMCSACCSRWELVCGFWRYWYSSWGPRRSRKCPYVFLTLACWLLPSARGVCWRFPCRRNAPMVGRN